nr:zinc finger, CCHC-type [Tanacetum cinerariifolium]
MITTIEGCSNIIVNRVFEGGATRRSAMTANVPVINAGDGLGKLDGIKVGLVGDLLSNGRTVRLLAYLLSKYNNVKIYFVSPAEDIKEYITLKEVDWEESADLMEVASKCDVDVLYVMQKHAAVMHPLPRLDEAAFFRQAKNGLYIRMALLKLLLLAHVCRAKYDRERKRASFTRSRWARVRRSLTGVLRQELQLIAANHGRKVQQREGNERKTKGSEGPTKFWWILRDIATAITSAPIRDILKLSQKVRTTEVGIRNQDQRKRNQVGKRTTCPSHRPDITYVVGRLRRHISSPGKEHWDVVNRVFKYLKQTMDYGLEYSGVPSVLEGYTDASWITDQEDYASTSGWIFTLGGGAVPWGSKKQSCLTDFAMAVEFMALVSLLRDLLINITLWPKPMAPIFVHCDSQSTLSRAYNQVYNGKSRHIGLRHKQVNQLINDGVITNIPSQGLVELGIVM